MGAISRGGNFPRGRFPGRIFYEWIYLGGGREFFMGKIFLRWAPQRYFPLGPLGSSPPLSVLIQDILNISILI